MRQRERDGPVERPLGKLSFGVGFALLLTTAMAWGESEKDDNNFQKDVIECEEALARLDKCCPDFDSTRVLCNYFYSFNSGCGSSTEERVSPALSEPESKCIRDTDCETMKAKGVCRRAQEAQTYSSRVTTDNSSSTSSGSTSGNSNTSQKHPPVCP